MNFTKEQIDFVKHCGEHFEVLIGGRGHSKTKQIIEQLQQENARLKETLKKIKNYIKEHDCDYIYLDCKFLETQMYNDLLQMLNKLKEN